MRDYYEILGVSKNADQDLLEKSLQRLSYEVSSR